MINLSEELSAEKLRQMQVSLSGGFISSHPYIVCVVYLKPGYMRALFALYVFVSLVD